MSLRYTLSGRQEADAETVVLSPGLGGSAGFWAPQMAALDARFRVLSYDHRGTGRNAEPLPERYMIADMARDVVTMLDDAGIGRAHFVGHALGGLVGLQMGHDDPERLGRLVVVNTWAAAGAPTRRCFEARLLVLAAGGPAAYARAQAIFLYPAAWIARNGERLAREEAHAVAHFQGEANLRARIRALLAFDLRDALPRIAAPTLVVSARDDVLVPYTASEALLDGLPNATALTMAEGGHGCTATDPERFNDALLAFLATGDGAGPARLPTHNP